MSGTLFTLLVTGPGGVPIEGALVRPFVPYSGLALDDGAPRGDLGFRTDAEGRVEIPPLPSGPYDRRPRGRAWWRRHGDPVFHKVVVWKEGYEPVVNRGPHVELTPAEPVEVEVRGGAGCQLRAVGPQGWEDGVWRVNQLVQASIDEDPQRVVLHHVPSHARSQVWCPGFRQDVDPASPIVLEVGRAAEVRMTGDAVTLTSVDAVCGGRSVRWENRDRFVGEPVTTVRLEHLTGDRCEIRGSGFGADQRRFHGQVELLDTMPEVELALVQDELHQERPTRRVRVVDAQGLPVSGARVVPMPEEEIPLLTRGNRIPVVIERAATTDADGFAEVGLWDWTTQLAVLAEGYGRSRHPLADVLTVQSAPAELVPLVIDGLPADRTCILTVTDGLLEQSAPLGPEGARFWAPARGELRILDCRGWQARPGPAITRIRWGDPVEVRSERPFVSVAVTCEDRRTGWYAPRERLAPPQGVRQATIEGAGDRPCEVKVSFEDGGALETTLVPAPVWELAGLE